MDSFKELVLAMAESIDYAVPALSPIDEGLLAAVDYREIDEVRALLNAGAAVPIGLTSMGCPPTIILW
ncbi:MAG TPA: hypothetical protein ENI27_09705 [bacterium]|nr:hypothetical protein [bacterium]